MSVLPSLNSIKVGLTILFNGEPYQVQTANFVRMQQRKPVAQTKIKNLITGKVLNRNFQHTDNFQEAEINYKKVKFLYTHRDKFVFCDAKNPAARFELSEESIGDKTKFLKPNSEVEVVDFEEKMIALNLPIKMQFKVVEAPPSIKGNTAQGGNKAVKIETGAMIAAPLFVEEGDIIEVNTQTGGYTGRV